jgi:hypothetical protein
MPSHNAVPLLLSSFTVPISVRDLAYRVLRQPPLATWAHAAQLAAARICAQELQAAVPDAEVFLRGGLMREFAAGVSDIDLLLEVDTAKTRAAQVCALRQRYRQLKRVHWMLGEVDLYASRDELLTRCLSPAITVHQRARARLDSEGQWRACSAVPYVLPARAARFRLGHRYFVLALAHARGREASHYAVHIADKLLRKVAHSAGVAPRVSSGSLVEDLTHAFLVLDELATAALAERLPVPFALTSGATPPNTFEQVGRMFSRAWTRVLKEDPALTDLPLVASSFPYLVVWRGPPDRDRLNRLFAALTSPGACALPSGDCRGEQFSLASRSMLALMRQGWNNLPDPGSVARPAGPAGRQFAESAFQAALEHLMNAQRGLLGYLVCRPWPLVLGAAQTWLASALRCSARQVGGSAAFERPHRLPRGAQLYQRLLNAPAPEMPALVKDLLAAHDEVSSYLAGELRELEAQPGMA